MPAIARKALAEFIGTGFLLIAVIGSGIAAQRLSPSDTGLALLENALATGAALAVVIALLGGVSGAHLNPLVSAAETLFGGLRRIELGVYAAAQIGGAVVGTVVANAMFSVPAISISSHERSGGGLWLGEVVATFGLLLVIFGLARGHHPEAVPLAVGAYIAGAYFFTSSTSFANPSVTLARMLSDTFAGIAPSSAPAFIAAQLAGGLLAVVAIRVLWPDADEAVPELVVPSKPPSAPPSRSAA